MNTVAQHYKTLMTAARPLPDVLRRPALLRFWLFKPVWTRVTLFAGLSIFLLAADPISQAIVDAWHPLNQDSFKTGMMELLNSPILRELENLRETRYWQLLITFWVMGLSAAWILLILDLPRSIEAGEQMSAELLRKSEEVRDSNPFLCETLNTTAKNLKPDKMPMDQPVVKEDTAPADIAKTRAVPRAEKEVRFVGPNQRYRIDKALASGGAGIVHQAEDTVLGRKVALKELLEDLAGDEEQAKRFKSEARALALLNHAYILPIYDLLEENGHFWLVMELLTGGTLNDRIEKSGTLDINQCIGITKGIASGLGFAHQQGFVHRDIKPANILFADDGSFRITDFGIAKHLATGIKTSHGLVLGSPEYMSPEQASGEQVDARSDIYSLGITMFQMLTEELPFRGDTSSVMAQHITRPASPPSTINASVSKKLDQVVLKMLAKKPDERFQSMTELIEILNDLN